MNKKNPDLRAAGSAARYVKAARRDLSELAADHSHTLAYMCAVEYLNRATEFIEELRDVLRDTTHVSESELQILSESSHAPSETGEGHGAVAAA